MCTSAGLGKADFQFDFENGWMLKGIHDQSDNTELLKTIASFIPKPDGAAGGAPKEPTDCDHPCLYSLEYDGFGRVCNLRLVNVKGDMDCAAKPAATTCCK